MFVTSRKNEIPVITSNQIRSFFLDPNMENRTQSYFSLIKTQTCIVLEKLVLQASEIAVPVQIRFFFRYLLNFP